MLNRQAYFTDQLGSIVAVTNSSGGLTAQTRYLANGEVRADYDMSGITAYGYTFQQVVADSGLMDYKARAYDPFLQKFIQPDTVVAEPGSSQGYNRYVYVNNDPVNHTDPSGNRPCDDGNLDGLCDAPLESRGSGETPQNNNLLQIPCGGILGSLEGATCNNVNQALNILSNPRATNAQKFWSGYYVAVVVNTHVAIGVGLTIAGWELVTGAGTVCIADANCVQTIWSNIQVNSSKINYLLNDPNKIGFSKMGYDSESLFQQIVTIGNSVTDDMFLEVTEYGTKFISESEVIGPNGSVGRITSIWQVNSGSDLLRFITAWPELFK